MRVATGLALLFSACAALLQPLAGQDLSVCEPVRVVSCDGDCAASRLTATARLWHSDRDGLLLDPVAKLRLSATTDEGYREYRVVGLTGSAVAVPGPDGPRWVRLRTGWSRGDGPIEVPTPSVDRLYTRVPRGRGSGALRGALVGAGVGLGVGIAAAVQPCTGLECFGNAIGFWGSLILGPPVGAVVGAIAPGKRWSESTLVAEPRNAVPAPGRPSDAALSSTLYPGAPVGRCDRVRATYCEGGCESPLEATGRILDGDATTLRLLSDQVPELDRRATTHLEVAVPRTRREGVRHRALWGALAGAAVGLGLTGLEYHTCGTAECQRQPIWPITPSWTLVGGVAGGIVGARFPGERWTDVTDRVLPPPGNPADDPSDAKAPGSHQGR